MRSIRTLDSLWRGSPDVALPAVLEVPRGRFRIPNGLGCKDAARERKCGGVELKYGDIGKLVAVGIEEAVVEDASGFAGVWIAEDPVLLRVGDGLRGLPLMTLSNASWRLLACGR